MLFHTIQFAVFFVVVYGLYIMLPHKWQNRMLLLASYSFYGFWEWRYLTLILASTIIDYLCGLYIDNKNNSVNKKWFVCISLLANISLLCTFKYYDFFATNFQEMMGVFGLEVHPYFLNVALPIGISFYTFQTMSYTLDVSRGKIRACRGFLDFALYVSFFPQLIAGPIERGVRLLPQVLQPRKITKQNIIHGSYLVFWGLFLKVVIADNMADIVDPVYNGDNIVNGAHILLSTYAFAIQIFCDFSGYSLMAIGLALLMGFTLVENFKRPYFSKNISEFWRRWHISLSSWFRDYLFSPFYMYFQGLGWLKKYSYKTKHAISFFVTLFTTEFLLGLWHGAGWNYAFFGVYHALLIWIYYYTKKYWDRLNSYVQIFLTFHIACIGWLIFRATSFSQATVLFVNIFSGWSFADPLFIIIIGKFFLLLLVPLIHEIIEETTGNRYVVLLSFKYIQYFIFTAMIVLMMLFGRFGEKKFIYFQF